MAKRTKKENTKVVKPEETKPEVTNTAKTQDAPDLETPPEEQTPDQKAYVASQNKYVGVFGKMPDETLNTAQLNELIEKKENESEEDTATEENTEVVETPEGPSKSLDKILGDVHAGKKVKIKSEKGVHFIYSGDGRLNKYDDKTGSFLESAPLYSFQDKDGWSVED